MKTSMSSSALNERIADTLDKAADLYESGKVDWCQGAYVSVDGVGVLSVCASQALIMACGGTVQVLGNNGSYERSLGGVDIQYVDTVMGALGLPEAEFSGPWNERRVIVWNDKDDVRTKQDVIDLFKNKAKELRNQA